LVHRNEKKEYMDIGDIDGFVRKCFEGSILSHHSWDAVGKEYNYWRMLFAALYNLYYNIIITDNILGNQKFEDMNVIKK